MKQKNLLLLLVAAALMASCTFELFKPPAPAAAPPADAADLNRECSSLRADIASGQHQQRNAPPTSSSPVIAEAAGAKADQKIEALKERYTSLGCAVTAPEPSATKP
jgi:hypothetical protein